jgi:hypothetical protein
MILNKLTGLFLATTLLASVGLAKELPYDTYTYSLVGIEGGYSSLDYENGVKTNNVQGDVSLAQLGLKLGAETKDFRAFVSGRYFYDSGNDYDYIVTYGGSLQYKFNIAKSMNLFLGVNGGIANIKFRADGEDFSRTLQEPYVGGDIGTNIHLGKKMDLEFGARVMSIQGDNTIDGVTYRVNNIVSGYGSLIFRWQMK